MSAVKAIKANYLDNRHWPICADVTGHRLIAEDDDGDIECPFCFTILCLDGSVLSVGDGCPKCSAVVVEFFLRSKQ